MRWRRRRRRRHVTPLSLILYPGLALPDVGRRPFGGEGERVRMTTSGKHDDMRRRPWWDRGR